MSPPGLQRTVAAEATMFWLALSGLITLSSSLQFLNYGQITDFAATTGVAIFYFGLGVGCLQRRIFFLISVAASILFAGFITSILYSTMGILLFILQSQIIFFGFKAYRETKPTPIKPPPGDQGLH